ncbi:MAG TPA: hypothetical protein DCE80_03310 [Ignavibacteriales bacterium]|nr:hypothetical protein [Ignavibacteriales bacterium]
MRIIATIVFLLFCLISFGQNESKIDCVILNSNDSTMTLSFIVDFSVPMENVKDNNNNVQTDKKYFYIDTLKLNLYNQLKDCVDFYYKIPTCILDIVDYIENDSLKEEAISLYVRETFLNEIKTVSSTQVQIQNGETKTNVKLTINFVVYKGIINKITIEPIEFFYGKNEVVTNKLKVNIK